MPVSPASSSSRCAPLAPCPWGTRVRFGPRRRSTCSAISWDAGEPDWAAALRDPRVKLHLYGKAEARPGRKMGHLTAFGDDAEDAAQRALAARTRLSASARGG
ncbi:MAG: hypothetical protein U5L11_15260 [Arhodomonas sp.]|nr:hypothetical protein [Arhodomonas sp.]